MKTLKTVLLTCTAGASLMLAACTSSDAENQPKADFGTVRLGVDASASFTRAVTESEYANTANYTVSILNSEGTDAVEPFLYGDHSGVINLPNGSYVMKAEYGEESVASRDEFYVFGETNFAVNGEDVRVNVDCYPTCGKLVTYFDKAMAEYFTDYYVIYETEALGGANVAWTKDDEEPWYVKLNESGEVVKATIHTVRKSDGAEGTVEMQYAMSPGKSWTMTIAPKDGSGSLSLTITIDESTNDIEKDIWVPSDWI